MWSLSSPGTKNKRNTDHSMQNGFQGTVSRQAAIVKIFVITSKLFFLLFSQIEKLRHLKALEMNVSIYWDFPKVLLKSVAMRCPDFLNCTI